MVVLEWLFGRSADGAGSAHSDDVLHGESRRAAVDRATHSTSLVYSILTPPRPRFMTDRRASIRFRAHLSLTRLPHVHSTTIRLDDHTFITSPTCCDLPPPFSVLQSLHSNSFSGAVPSYLGQLTQMKYDMVSHGGRPSTVRPTRPASSPRFSRCHALFPLPSHVHPHATANRLCLSLATCCIQPPPVGVA